MEASGSAGRLLAALLLGGGIALGGWLVGEGLRAPRAGDRYVSVKGLAEREVRADLALWPLRFVATGNDLAEVRRRVAENEQAVRRFLAEGGIDAAAVGVAGYEVTDALAQVYRSGPVESRFVIAQTLLVRTGGVDRVAALAQRSGDLVAAGVVLSSEGGPASGPVYAFAAQRPQARDDRRGHPQRPRRRGAVRE